MSQNWAIDEAARGFIGAVTEGAYSLAEQIERGLHRDDPSLEEPRPELLLTCLMFVLYLTDPVAISSLTVPSREHFMSAILNILSETIDEDYLRAEYNAVQSTYTAFKELLPEPGKGSQGTLFWEFGKIVCREYNHVNPAIIALGKH
jgi:hypothetical protein